MRHNCNSDSEVHLGRKTNSDEILDDGHEREDEGPSKSARKRAATAAQKLGEKLIGLRPADLARLPLPAAAVSLAPRVTWDVRTTS